MRFSLVLALLLACPALAQDARTEGVKELLEQLGNEDISVRWRAARNLAGIGPQVIPVLINSLEHHNPLVRCWAAKTLGLFGPAASSAVPALITALSDRNSDARICAANTLQAIGPSAAPAVPVLARNLSGPDDEVVIHSAEALVGIGSASVPALCASLNARQSNHSQEWTMIALGRIGPSAAPAVPTLEPTHEWRGWRRSAVLTPHCRRKRGASPVRSLA